MMRSPTLSRVSGAAMVVATLGTVALRIAGPDVRAWGRPAWLTALGVALALLAARLAMMASAARRGDLPWPRLVLPAIFLVEGAGLWWGDGATGWQQLRLVTAIGLEVTFIGLAIRQLRRATDRDELPEVRLARPLSQLVPPGVARLIAFELVIVGAALRFALGGWRRPAAPGCSYHRESGLRVVLQMLPLIAIGDIALLELVFLPHAALWLRIVVHVLAGYGLLWLIGLYASARARPHQVAGGRAILHRAMLGHVELAVDQIASVGDLPAFRDDWQRRAYRKQAICMGVRGPTEVELRLRAPVQPVGVIGPGRARDRVVVAVDDRAAFLAALGAPGAQAAPVDAPARTAG